MKTKRKEMVIDASKGGFGEIWMRIIGFYTVAGLNPRYEMHLLVPPFLYSVFVTAFGDRLNFMTSSGDKEIKYVFSTMGLRHLVKDIARGKQYVLPILRTTVKEKKVKSPVKDQLNILVSVVMDSLKLVNVPKLKWYNTYLGFMEMVSFRQFRWMTYESFSKQTKLDYSQIYERLNGNLPLSPEFKLPEEVKNSIVVFPSGTSRQFMPVEWAKKHLPDANYAFFHKENELANYLAHGMKTVLYYKEPGDMIAISKAARWTILTDSFHSHLIQSANKRSTVLITELLKDRVVNPAFPGKIVDSIAPCHPCVHINGSRTCEMGYKECLNWTYQKYTNAILETIPGDSRPAH